MSKERLRDVFLFLNVKINLGESKMEKNVWLIICLVFIAGLIIGLGSFLVIDNIFDNDQEIKVIKEENDNLTDEKEKEIEDQKKIADEVYNKLKDWIELTKVNNHKDNKNEICSSSSSALLGNDITNVDFWDVYAPYFYFCEYDEAIAIEEMGNINQIFFLTKSNSLSKYYEYFPNIDKVSLFNSNNIVNFLKNRFDMEDYQWQEFIANLDKVDEFKKYYDNYYLITIDTDGLALGDGNNFVYTLGNLKKVNEKYEIDIVAEDRIDYGEGKDLYEGKISFSIVDGNPVFDELIFSLKK